MDPITGLLSFLGSLFGGGGAAAGGAAGATTTLAPAAGSGVGATVGGGSLGMTGSLGQGLSLAAANPAAGAGITGTPAVAAANPGLMQGLLTGAKDALIGTGVVQAVKSALPKTSEEMMKKAGDATGFNQAEKVYTTITSPTMSMRDKFDTIAPMSYEASQRSNAQFQQLQQAAQPTPMASYRQPSAPYQGGGIDEILARQRGLLR